MLYTAHFDGDFSYFIISMNSRTDYVFMDCTLYTIPIGKIIIKLFHCMINDFKLNYYYYEICIDNINIFIAMFGLE